MEYVRVASGGAVGTVRGLESCSVQDVEVGEGGDVEWIWEGRKAG